MNKDTRPYLTVAAVALAAALIGCGWFLRGCADAEPVKPPVVVVEPEKPKADQVVYVYEKDQGGVPSAVAAGLDKLNRAGINASPFERNTTDGTNEVPDQYKAALEAAYKAELPALVVLGKGEVLKVVKAPTTTEQVTEAVE